MERLQKYIARCGTASRRHAEEMIREGKVAVNGTVVTHMGLQIDPDKDRVSVAGKLLQPKKQQTYILLYKPAGVVSTCDDPAQRQTVMAFLPTKERLFPVGRLDYDTEGLLLLTDDGDLTNRLTHPKHEVPKTYLVETEGLLTGEKAGLLRTGVRLEEGTTLPAKVRVDYAGREGSRFHLTIREGKNRQIRRMCESLGLPVTYLCRVKLGFLDLQGLKPGESRRLETWEVQRLKEESGREQ